MSITLFSGIPRSGKTYKMVAETWKLRNSHFIIHNIVGFKNEVLNGFGFDWVKYINGENPDKSIIDADVFFSKDFQVQLAALIKEKYDRPMLVIIDEAHEWFDVHKKAIKMWLSYHGHLNQQIYLVAHASTNIPKVYRSFLESEYRAKSSSFLFIPNYFFYNRLLGGVRSGYILEKKDQKIFDLYKSSDIEEAKKKKSWYVPLLVGVIIFGFLLFVMAPKFLFSSHKKDDSKKLASGADSARSVNSDTLKNAVVPISDSVSFDKKYAYVGNINSEVIIEDRKTGVQYPLSRISDEYKLVKYDRNNSCILFNRKAKLVTLYNFDRFIPAVASPVPYPSGALFDNKEIVAPVAAATPVSAATGAFNKL
jgi:zona occludens toxin (predicted ATPase)